MIRILAALFLFAFAVASNAQPAVSPAASPVAPRFEVMFPDKASLDRSIALNESTLQKAHSLHSSDRIFIKIYSNLGALYEDAALYLKAEDAMRHAIALLRSGPQDQLAAQISHLGILHSSMNKIDEAEKDTQEAVRIRESIGEPIGIALARGDLAAIYIKQHNYKKALDSAQKSYEVLNDNPAAEPADRIAAKQTLAYALCYLHQCDRAIPLAQDAVQLSSASFGPNSLSVGCASFLLGHTYWKAGDMDQAAYWMQRGTQRMKADMGWGHAIYVSAMGQYAEFLRKRGQTEAASAAELEVRHATSIVDARSFTAR